MNVEIDVKTEFKIKLPEYISKVFSEYLNNNEISLQDLEELIKKLNCIYLINSTDNEIIKRKPNARWFIEFTDSEKEEYCNLFKTEYFDDNHNFKLVLKNQIIGLYIAIDMLFLVIKCVDSYGNIDSEKIERKAIKNIYAIKYCLEKFDF